MSPFTSPARSVRALLVALIAALFVVPSALARGGPVLVKDISPFSDSRYGTNPVGFTLAGETIFFAATDTGNGRELWKSDGTAAGTTLLKDIFPGPASSGPTG